MCVTPNSYIATSAGTGRSTIFSEAEARSEPVPVEEVERALVSAEVLWLAAVPRNDLIRPLSSLAAKRGVPLYLGLSTVQIEELGYEGLGRQLAGPVELLVCNRHEAEVFTGREKVPEQLHALRYGGRVRTQG